MLTEFRKSYPAIHVEARIDRNLALNEQLTQGELDLIVTFRPTERATAVFAVDLPLRWIGRSDFEPTPGQDLSLALLNPPCLFRQAAIEALEQARVPWRVGFTSANLTGVWAATEAGLGITARTALGVPNPLTAIPEVRELPALPTIGLGLYRTADTLSAAGEHLQTLLIKLLASHASSSRTAPDSR